MTTIASANVAPQVSASADPPASWIVGAWQLDPEPNWEAASSWSAPRPEPALTVFSFPRPSQRAALRATKAIAPSRAAFVAKPQVRHRSTHPRSAEPNL